MNEIFRSLGVDYIIEGGQTMNPSTEDMLNAIDMVNISVEENEAVMAEEVQRVATGQVTYAVRDTMIDNQEIHQGDFMGIGDKGILAVGTDLQSVAFNMVQKMMSDEFELISIYYGDVITKEQAQRLADQVQAEYSGCDVELQFGGQPIYSYIISAE